MLEYIRAETATTRGELAELTGLSRSNIAERVGELAALGLVVEAGTARSTGGRAPVRLRFNHLAGCVAAVDMGTTGVRTAITDLHGRTLVDDLFECRVSAGPQASLAAIEKSLESLLESSAVAGIPLTGIGLGFPGPVQFASGHPTSPASAPSWDGYPIREQLARRFEVDAWVDNEANMLALGELRLGAARRASDVVVVKFGTGIGAGLVSGGQLQRGHLGGAGDIAHVSVPGATSARCSCGRASCLTTVASGAALGRTAVLLAESGASPTLRELVTAGRTPTVDDLAQAAAGGDLACIRAIEASASHLGHVLAMLVNVLNPELVLLAGRVMESADLVLPVVRRTIYAESTPLTTRALRIERSAPDGHFGISGAALTVVDKLLEPERLGAWPAARSQTLEAINH
ncbi:ROK family transcriptional regulator [Streptomyces mayonensis]|uniref:ROK family transcriptional regulator n=1 Tax=Streptomyces mayonensis TaxID=2750816 RepID=UPI001C1E3DD2|nr:ROK family transcriptional regulator [Streptomyces sp. A108]MBU6529615.1 ROK family transcriptional regulator [Streptomyces sp. A108]